MIYRIVFEPKGGYWKIQFQKYLAFWEDVTVVVESVETGGVETLKVKKFDTITAAESWAHDRGIDKAYDRARTRDVLTAIQANNTETAEEEEPESEPTKLPEIEEVPAVVRSGRTHLHKSYG